MGYPRTITKRILAAKSGTEIQIFRDPSKQTRRRFSMSISSYRAAWKEKHGILTTCSVVGDVATIYVLQGLDQSTTPLAEALERRDKLPEPKAPHVQAAPLPPPEPSRVVLRGDDERGMWRDTFLESVRMAPGAPPEHHCAMATAAAESMVSAFGDSCP